MKNKFLVSIFLLFVTLTLITIASTSAQSTQTVLPGVSKGDFFEYNHVVTWSSTNSTATIPEEIAQLSKTQRFKIEILDITGTTINVAVTSTYRDGTIETATGFVDIASGAVHVPYGSLIIAGNLNEKDKIYPLGGDAIINKTISMAYQSESRQTNQRFIEISSQNHQVKSDIYYDKVKGIAVSSVYQSVDQFVSATETYTETITITNSNVWAAALPESTATTTSYPTTNPTNSAFPTINRQTPTRSSNLVTIAVLVAVIVVLVALLLVRGRGRRRKSRVDEEFAEYLKPKKP